MNRREFIKTAGVAWMSVRGRRSLASESVKAQGSVMTVLGPISRNDMGVTLVHEHALVDFIGADKVSRDRYDAEEAFRVILPFLQRVKKRGCRTFVECTPAYIGRDAQLLKRLSESTGLNILTNTGYYGAANDKFVPAHAHKETADQLAARWQRKWEEGIKGTGIRPGFIKTGVDAGALSAIDEKLIRAACRAHLRTGLSIAAHTGDTEAALGELTILAEEGVDASAFIWVHAQNGWDAESRAKATKAGAWIEIDNVGLETVAACVGMVKAMKERGVLNRVLVSQDAGWYAVGEPGGGNFRPFETLFTKFVPALKEAGFTDGEIRQILVKNPRERFTIRIRQKTKGRSQPSS